VRRLDSDEESSLFYWSAGRKDSVMDERRLDPTAFKAQQREQWSDVAQGWRRRWATFEKGAQPLSSRMMELAQIAPGKRVLDVATGIGEPAMTAARLVGASGSVVAIDQAPQMLAVARERMQAAGISNVEFVEGDAETVALPLDAFDAVVCRWGMMFFTDPVGALTRLRASLVSGGRLVAAIWGPPERVPLISLPFAALAGANQQPAPPPGPSPFALSNPAALEQVARDADFVDVRSEPLTVTFEFSSVDELLVHLGDVSASIRAITATQSPEGQAAFWSRLAEAALVYTDTDGMVRLPNQCLIVAGRP
jgi:enediyne biosynthesis protein CalE5